MKDTSKIIFSIGIVVMALATVLVFVRPQGPQGAAAPANGAPANGVSADRLLHDFGTISMKNGIATTLFTINNLSGQPVSMERLYTSCMCTKAYLLIDGEREGPFGMPGHGIVPRVDRVLQPGAQAQIEVQYDPNAHGPAGVGRIQRTVTIESSGRELVTFSIKALVTP